MLPGTRLWVAVCLTLSAGVASACQTCRPQWQSGVYNADFGRTLGTLLIPFAVLGAIAYGVYKSDGGPRG